MIFFQLNAESASPTDQVGVVLHLVTSKSLKDSQPQPRTGIRTTHKRSVNNATNVNETLDPGTLGEVFSAFKKGYLPTIIGLKIELNCSIPFYSTHSYLQFLCSISPGPKNIPEHKLLELFESISHIRNSPKFPLMESSAYSRIKSRLPYFLPLSISWLLTTAFTVRGNESTTKFVSDEVA
jgi:hypothetical protein